MLVVVVYDICTTEPGAEKRARKIRSICKDRGTAVQSSVFECHVDAQQYRLLKAELGAEMDKSCDSVRFYLLGNRYTRRVEQLGISAPIFTPDTTVL